MHVIEAAASKKHSVSIEPLTYSDFDGITKKRYSFNWKSEKGQRVYKLTLPEQTEILGLISMEVNDDESRINIRLLAVSKENIGRAKLYERIAGSLFAYAGHMALDRYGVSAAISLKPKTRLGQHYMDEYGFEQAGINLFMEGKNLRNLLKYYDND